MLTSVLFSSPFAVIRYFVGTAAFFFDILLIYAVWKHTPAKMQEIKPILLTMVTTEMLAGQSGGLACAPEYLYPLPVLRINGYFKFIGPYYGGVVSVVTVVMFLVLIGLSILECCLYRYITVTRWHVRVNSTFFIYFNVALTLIGFLMGFLIAVNFFLLDVQGLIIYAENHNISNVLKEIDLEHDTIATLNLDSPIFVPITLIMLFLICSSVIAVHVLCFATHRHMKQHFQAAQASSVFYGQQQRLTWMLFGQGSLPAVMIVIICGLTVPAIVNFSYGVSPSQLNWEIVSAIVALYPLFSSILTCVFTQPYYLFMKTLLLRLSGWKRSPKELSVTIVRL